MSVVRSVVSWFGLAPLILAPAFWAFAWLAVSIATDAKERQNWRLRAVLGMMVIAGTVAIIGTLLIFLAPLNDGIDSALVILVWLSLMVEMSPFYVSLLTNRRRSD